MRIKIRPVRWWRPDEDRHKSRGVYVAPPERLAGHMLWDMSKPTPIEDIKAAIAAMRRLVER